MHKFLRSGWYLGMAGMILAPIMFIYTNCSSSPAQGGGPVATTGVAITEKIVLLRDGYNGYSGTRDTTIYESPTDWSAYLIVGPAPAGQVAVSAVDVGQSNKQRSFGLISFDVAGVASEFLSASETCSASLEVARATLDIFVSPGAVGSYMALAMMKSTAPAWTEADATFTMANSTTAWPASPNAIQPILNSAELGFFDAHDGVVNNAIYRRITFELATDFVRGWICDSTANKGLLWRVNSSTSNTARFFTREFPDRTFRTLLTLWLRKI